MDIVILGGLVRAIQGVAAASTTLVVGLFVAALLRYYVGPEGTRRLFGGDGLRSLAQSWLIGMLLPVCSIGVIPILREMKRMGLRPGAITAFALSAPLFNPLSLLYGLTLSRPSVILGFAFGSLAVVTILGTVWDRFTTWKSPQLHESDLPVGLGRLGACAIHMVRELFGPSGLYALIAISGLFLLGAVLPHGALQSSVEQLDPMAPLMMAIVSIPVYAPPMLTMSQLGMMFDHGNSPGAAFCLLLLGTGMNLATLVWIGKNYSWRSTAIWFGVLMIVVVGCAYAIERPLIPPGVEPAGHTHAFDIYTNPLHSGEPIGIARLREEFRKTIGLFDALGLGILAAMAVGGWVVGGPCKPSMDRFLESLPSRVQSHARGGLDRDVPPVVVGMTGVAGLFAFSIVGCYAYYPAPEEVLEEMRLARVELLSGVASKDYERVLHWIPILEEWSRKLEVGYAMRHYELRPYQRMQTFLLRKKLELLEHATEHLVEVTKSNPGEELRAPTIDLQDMEEHRKEIDELRYAISQNGGRLVKAFRQPEWP
ncbi:putative permease [Pirellula sp. SH-Sr6A]|uniref:permease n=1 Tax=Pirellula sp. SH-Sr6A TaxID=1632865 RepID=UPI00078D89BB|nr:permease [Pirellula sp. SH-Sr6A]AMV33062.1 putative permease [Pirellula sp. SH-Sr6A]